jgi:hypothetical protein
MSSASNQIKSNQTWMAWFVIVVLVVQGFFCAGIVARVLTKQFLVNRGIENAWTHFVMGFENNNKNSRTRDPNLALDSLEEVCGSLQNYYSESKWNLGILVKLSSFQLKFEGYVKNKFPLRPVLMAIATPLALNGDARKIKWLPDGHMYEPKNFKKAYENALKLKNFENLLSKSNIPLLVVLAPALPNEQPDSNSVLFMRLLDSLNLWNLNLAANNPFGADGFYKTDHHWKIQTAFWAAQKTAEQINQKLQYHLDMNLYQRENFDSIVHQNMYLGSYGRRLYLDDSFRENFVELWPKYQTDYTVLTTGGKLQGIFKDVFGRDRLSLPNSMNEDFYIALFPTFLAENHDSLAVPKTVLVVGHSYIKPFAGFLSLGFSKVASLSRLSVTQCIISTISPDLVIALEHNGGLSDPILREF